jgi:RHS repeat-associated protein
MTRAEGDVTKSGWRTDGGKTNSYSVTAAGATTTVEVTGRDEAVTSKYTGGVTQTTRTLYDAVLGSRYPAAASVTMPSGRTFTSTLTRAYIDGDGDEVKETQVNTTTVEDRSVTTMDDARAGIATVIAPSGRRVVSRYSTTTLLPISVEASGLARTQFEYTPEGRLARSVVGSRVTTLSYDTSGNLDALTAPDGRSVTFAHDAAGRVKKVTRPDSSTISYSYDPAGFTTAIVNGRDETSTFEPTANGRRESWTSPGSATFSYLYDRQGRLARVTAPSGASINQTYTAGLHRKTTFDGGSIDLVRPKCGRLDAARRGSEVASLTYDGWLTTRDVRSSDGGSFATTIGFGYDDSARLSALGYAGATDTIGYDPDGMLAASGPFTIERTAEAGLPATVTAASFTLSRAISAYGETDGATTTVGAATPFGYAVSRDAAGRIVGKTETTSGGSTEVAYGYDRAGRLATVTVGGQLSESYAYDAAGNRIAMRVPARGIEDTLTLAVDARDRVVTAGDDTYAFDVDGRMTARHTAEGTTTLAYTGLSELSTVTLPTGSQVSYVYDGLGRRVARKIDGAVTERYLFADATRLLATYDGDGQLTARFTYADARVPYLMTTPSGTYRLSFDQVGSLRTVTDSTGDAVKEISYDSFGVVLSDSNPGLAVPLGFAGGLADADTGLVHFGAREYAPELGRFCSLDPIDFAGGDANLYGYCMGDPVNLVDPSGLAVDWATTSAVLGVAGAVCFFAALALSPATPFLIAGLVFTALSLLALQGAYACKQVNPKQFKEGTFFGYLTLTTGGAGFIGPIAAKVSGLVGFGLTGTTVALSGTQPGLSADQWQDERIREESDKWYWLDDLGVAPPPTGPTTGTRQ